MGYWILRWCRSFRNKISSILPELRPKEENENEANPVGEAIPKEIQNSVF